MSNLKIQLTNIIETATSTASRLNKKLSSNDNTALKSCMNTILPVAERLERLLRTTQVDELLELSKNLEICAIDLWNVATLSIKSEPADTKKTLCSVKFFSCLLCSIHEIMNPSLKVKFRAMKCFVKTLKAGLDEEEITLVSKIQEHADREFKSLESISSTFEPVLLKDFQKVKIELFITKMQISILEMDVEMAKFYEERADLSNVSKDYEHKDLILESTRIIFNSCLILFNKGLYSEVIYFLKKTTGYITSETKESSLVKSSVCSLLAYAGLEIKTEESYDVASYAIDQLQQCSPDSLDCFKLDILLKRQQGLNSHNIEDTIMRMLISVPVMERFTEILAIINDYSNNNPVSALKCYDFAFTNKLDPSSDHDSLEMLFVAIINAYTKDKITPQSIKQPNLKRFLDSSEKVFCKALSKKSSSASVTLLWTAAKAESKNSNFQDSVGWFNLCLHRVICINEIDKAKVQRALQHCYIELEEYDKVLEVYNDMRELEKQTLITQYNMFKFYSHECDTDKLMMCVKNISNSSDSNMVPLLALCAINSKSDSTAAIESMLALFKKLSEGLDSTISIPATLRYVMELILKQEASYSNFFKSQYMDTLLVLLKDGFKFASDSVNISNYKFSNDELKWFSSQTFNISRNCLLSENYNQGLLFSEVSIKFNTLISDDISIKDSIWLRLWRFRSCLIQIMCSSKLPDLNHKILWSSVREQSLKLRLNIDEMMIIYRNEPEFEKFENEWRNCLLDSIIFQYEAELELNNWSSIESILNETTKISTIELDSTFINILINDKFPYHIKSMIISQIITRNFNNSLLEGTTLSRWLRLLLKYSIDSDRNEEICLNILNQTFIKLRSQGKVENSLPAHEIEWLSSSSWNIGVGKFFNDDKVQGRSWCHIAIKLSSFVNERFEITLKNLWEELTTTC